MIRQSTWIVLIVFVLVVGAAILVEKTPYFQPKPTPTSTTAPSLYSGTPVAFTLTESNGFTTSAKLQDNKTWVALQPLNGPVDQGQMAELISQIQGIAVVATLPTPPPASASGLQTPTDTITITDSTNQQHVLKIGSKTPTSSGYYVQLDQNNPVIVDTSTIDRIIQILSGVGATPTPTSSPTPNPLTPTSQATATPASKATGTASPPPTASPEAPTATESPTPSPTP